MEVVLLLFWLLLVLFEKKRFGSTKRVVYPSDFVRVAKGDTHIFARQSLAKFVERFQWFVDGDRAIQYNRENSLRGAGIVDNLLSKKQVLVLVSSTSPWIWIFGPFKEED
jgi:hypothetical protein